ncbi:hypothetical protein Mame01_33690 [Microbispora amethystogenes]|nr:hypothetical protein Mame01_33690 [Microbispora amethystogenes]
MSRATLARVPRSALMSPLPAPMAAASRAGDADAENGRVATALSTLCRPCTFFTTSVCRNSFPVDKPKTGSTGMQFLTQARLT